MFKTALGTVAVAAAFARRRGGFGRRQGDRLALPARRPPRPVYSGSLDHGVQRPAHQGGRRPAPEGAAQPAIDCFYVYPTVSDEKSGNSDLKIQDTERSIALYQASRYSQDCRVYAPMYRQVTLAGAGLPGTSGSTSKPIPRWGSPTWSRPCRRI